MLLNFLMIISFVSPFKDDLETPKKQEQSLPFSPLQIASLWLIALHQNFLTNVDGPRSHFIPCSSTFMKQAIKKHGFFHGSLLGLDRLMRENKDPWIYKTIQKNGDWIKSDPVP
jgi:uncharacterized protein